MPNGRPLMSSRAVIAWAATRSALRRRGRALAANVVSIASLATVCIGISLWSIPLALVAAGLAGLILSQGIEARP